MKMQYEAPEQTIKNPAASVDGKTFVMSTVGNKVIAVDVDTQQTKWTFDAGCAVFERPTFSEDGRTIFFGTDVPRYSRYGPHPRQDVAVCTNGTVFALEAETGKQIW